MSENERRRLLTSRTVKIAVPTIVALGAGGAFAVAAIPGNDGTISGCYVDRGLLKGTLRVVDDGEGCSKYETKLTWNQKGQPGPAGADGATGAAGPAGPQGAAGANGTQSILIGGEALNSGRAEGFVAIDGIKGESTDDKHAGEIDISSFSYGIKNSTPVNTGGGSGAGKATFSTFHFNKLVDASSTDLALAAASGKHFKSATFTFRKAGEGQKDFLKVTLSDVIVSSYHQGGTAEPPLLEDVELAPSKISVAYSQQAGDGSVSQPKTITWDIGTNKGG